MADPRTSDESLRVNHCFLSTVRKAARREAARLAKSQKDGLDLNQPAGESGNVISEGGVVHLVNKGAEECCSFFARIGLKLWIDLDDERGGDSRKQTSLVFIKT